MNLHRNEFLDQHVIPDASEYAYYMKKDAVTRMKVQLLESLWKCSLDHKDLIFFHGSEDALFKILMMAKIQNYHHLVVAEQAWAYYQTLGRNMNYQIHLVPPLEGQPLVMNEVSCTQYLDSLDASVVLMGYPDNPTGYRIETIIERAKKYTQHLFLLDCTYQSPEDYAETIQTIVPASSNIITITSVSKWFGLPGLRFGCGISHVPWFRNLELYLYFNPKVFDIVEKAISNVVYYKTLMAQRNDIHQSLLEKKYNRIKLHITPNLPFILVQLYRNQLDNTALDKFQKDHGVCLKILKIAGSTFFRISTSTTVEFVKMLEGLLHDMDMFLEIL